MTTQINITVDSGGLSERAKQQQQAARQAQLEKERTLNLSAEALDKRVAAQAAKGQSLNGQPLYTAGFKQPQVERRPAANRASSETVILTPLAAPLGTNIISPLTIPANESVIADPNSLRYKEKFGNFFLVGPAYGGGATTVLPTDPGLFSDFGPSLGKNSIRITDDSPSVSIGAFKYHSIAAQTLGGRKKMPVGSNAPFTVEAWLYVPQVDADTTGFWDYRFTLDLYANTGAVFGSAPFYSPVARAELYQSSQAYGENPLNFEFTWSALSADNDILIVSSPLNRFPVYAVAGQWNHISFWIKDEQIYWFVNGQLGAFQNQASIEDDLSPSLASYPETILQVKLDLSYFNFFTKVNKNDIMAMRGIRFTPKHLYPTTGFTPVMY